MSGLDIPGPAQLKPRLIGDLQDPGTGTVEKGPGRLFEETLSDALQEVRSLEQDSDAKYEALARGEHVEVHDLMIAVGKSEVAFNLMLEVRNKLLEAWQTLSRSVQ
jgi:flagellar hook-basal body complex protein FliE